MKKLLLLSTLALLGVSCAPVKQSTHAPAPYTPPEAVYVEDGFDFETPKQSAHYESNTPFHGAVLPAVPVSVVIDFNFDLAAPSSISITSNGVEYGVDSTTIDHNKLAMRRDVDRSAPNGLYIVRYDACWPDSSCHDGYFQFAIDRSMADAYYDLRGKQAISISLSGISFQPAHIRISKGAKITWTNDDSVNHYVNTDSHPAHTYFPAQNSQELKRGESFSLVFDRPGVYPYHCSAHAIMMIGAIIVD